MADLAATTEWVSQIAAATFFDDFAGNQLFLFLYLKGDGSVKAGLATTVNDMCSKGLGSGTGDTYRRDERTPMSVTDDYATADPALIRATRRSRRQEKQPPARRRPRRPSRGEAAKADTSAKTQRRIAAAFNRISRSWGLAVTKGALKVGTREPSVAQRPRCVAASGENISAGISGSMAKAAPAGTPSGAPLLIVIPMNKDIEDGPKVIEGTNAGMTYRCLADLATPKRWTPPVCTQQLKAYRCLVNITSAEGSRAAEGTTRPTSQAASL